MKPSFSLNCELQKIQEIGLLNIKIEFSLHLGVPDNQISLNLGVPDVQILLNFQVTDNQISLHLGVPDKCLFKYIELLFRDAKMK